MECFRNAVGSTCFLNCFPYQLQTFQSDDPSHIVPFVTIDYFVFLWFFIRNYHHQSLTEAVEFWGVSLLDNNFDYIFALKFVFVENGNILNSQLKIRWFDTSSRSVKSTWGYIFWTNCWMFNLNSSWSLRWRAIPWTSPYLSSTPIKIVPPFEFR